MLIETERGFQLWAQQFDCPDDSYAVSSLLRAILSRLEPQLIRAIFNELRGENSELSSRQLVIQSMSVLSVKGWHKDSFQEVAALLRKSIELEPDFAFSHAYLALILGLSKRVGLVSDSDQAAREAVVHADLALDLEEMDSNVLGLAGCALADVGQTSRAIPILRNAIDINPNNAQAHAALGAAHLEDREHKKAIEHLKTGIELSPLDGRLAVWYSILATAYLQAGESDQALDAAQKGCLAARMTYLPRVVLSAVYAQRGEQVKALAAMEESLRVKPDLSQNEIDRLVGPRLGKSLRKLREQITTDD
jgi:tetratricopeptide (TPR) repeat protein